MGENLSESQVETQTQVMGGLKLMDNHRIAEFLLLLPEQSRCQCSPADWHGEQSEKKNEQIPLFESSSLGPAAGLVAAAAAIQRRGNLNGHYYIESSFLYSRRTRRESRYTQY